MARLIGAGHDFNVGGTNARALIELVLNAGVRDLDLVVNVRQIELVGDLLFDFGQITVRIRLALGVECPLYVALDLEIEDDARIRAADTFNSLDFLEVGAIDLCVVLHLSRLYQSGVELLIVTENPDLTHDLLTRPCQRDNLNPFWLTPGTIAAGVN